MVGSASSAATASSVLLLADAEELSVLLGSQESDDGVGTNSEVVGWQAGPEASDTLLGHRNADAIHYLRVRQLAVGSSLLLLHLRLDVVEGKRSDSSGDGGEHAATELDLEGRRTITQSRCCSIFGRVVRDEHAHVESDGSRHSGHSTLPKSSDAFL